MKQYLDALRYCYDNGTDVESRSGSVRKSFGYQMHYDLSKGVPAITTKKLAWKSVVSELLWFSKVQTMKEDLLKFYTMIQEKI